ncbi:S-adenosyl-L-methionine-dependent methyltransferase [Rhizopogon vinicolor AM-OR11-026]|uniref:S-adenosyl-L-methionine-dependent methyltransferase n=1 Tax=Rhizopogon vinicolor AM-OR11-026 TaxID=1314800 RepID=A0A1B7MFG6_9AGAM|nr:S-adenosyl-L-methionine-dependent methyltransferase [Rhizopogon vinicolor AM-OR11-026]OAX31377.1 S-adenosyl-L-methionine-dependent methyltransferase [Rhizopogon vinicolor AM-OR11-026]
MSTRIRSPTSDPAPLEKKIRLDHPAMDGSDGAIEDTNDSALGVPGPSKKASKKSKKKQKHILPEPYSTGDVLWRDVVALLGSDVVEHALQNGTEWASPFDHREEVEVEVSTLSSNGDALARSPASHPPWVIVAPFALPRERIRVRVYRSSRLHSFADLVEVITPNPDLRDDSRVKCRYFGKCSGCQYQMLSYDTQLGIKRDVVIKAYQNFSNLPNESIPDVLPTIASPLQYGYRTKITPHFEAAPKKARTQAESGSADFSDKPNWLKIGFNEIGRRTVLDIEECPISTPVLNAALGPIREDIIKNIWSYKKGVSLLLRDSIEHLPSDMSAIPAPKDEKHVCITNHKETVRERVNSTYFEFPGHSFFQNNNSVLVPLTSYVRDAIFPSSKLSGPTHLVDAYCGSGLFSLMLAPYFETVAGIELSAESIKSATENAVINRLPEGKCSFLAGDAANIFSTVSHFPPDKTALIIDPPRKGSDEPFIQQLVRFACSTVIYVSCNVHTQARDVGMIMEMMEREGGGRKYVLESLRGFDLFPQTAHVESVAVLRLV